MTSKVDSLHYVKKLNFPCPLCGKSLFSVSCIEKSKIIAAKNSGLCVVLDNPREISSSHCSIFCFLLCNKRKIEINFEDIFKLKYKDGFPINEEYKKMHCGDFNREYRNIFERVLSLILLDRGFKI